MSVATFSYTPGGATAVCGPRIALLVGLAPTDERIGAIMATLDDPGSNLDDLLEILVSQGLRSVTDFAMAQTATDSVRVIVRGDFRVETEGAGSLAATGVWWLDQTLPAEPVTLIGTDEQPSGLWLPLSLGIALAGRIRQTAAVAPSAMPARDRHRQVDAAGPEPERQPDGESPSIAQPASEVPSRPLAVTVSGHTVPAWLATPGSPIEPEADEPNNEPEAEPAPEEAGFLSTMAWEYDDDDDDDVDEASARPTAAFPPPTQVLPNLSEPPPTTTGDVSAAISGESGPPMVQATRCPRGHLSPAYAGRCRVCRKTMASQPSFLVPRPPLGVLRLSNGDTVVLDRGVILGRNPRVPAGHTGAEPTLTKLLDPDKDISSQHLEVRLEAWHVVVKDLGSTNGTEVRPPGGSPVTLRPNDPLVIEPGTA
ncbi:MAG: FHA domain-containing protein, partial [Micropruina sp.]|nr:FHA domain-containing protein [Micropruina sp.]